MDRPVPNICLKVPTGGGKTLLGTIAVERVNAEYFKTQTGFVPLDRSIGGHLFSDLESFCESGAPLSANDGAGFRRAGTVA
jgi:hypothetical protein